MKYAIITLTLPLVLGIAACDYRTTATSTKESTISEKETHSPYPGKPSAPIRLDYQFVGKAQAGISLGIEIIITPDVDADTISASYTTSPSLVPADNLSEFNFTDVAANKAVKQTIHVIPQNEGNHYIHLSVTISSQKGRSGTRSFSIPVSVGNVQTKPSLPEKATIEEQQEGERLLIQKGKETRTIDQ